MRTAPCAAGRNPGERGDAPNGVGRGGDESSRVRFGRRLSWMARARAVAPPQPRRGLNRRRGSPRDGDHLGENQETSVREDIYS
jgi:hypothetical protein